MNYIKEFFEFLLEAEGKKMTRADFLKIAKYKWGDLYDYTQVPKESNFEGINKSVRINCKKHGPFNKTPLEHIKGEGCPDCTASKKFNKTVNQKGYIPGTAEEDPEAGKGSPFYISQHKAGRKLINHRVGGGRTK